MKRRKRKTALVSVTALEADPLVSQATEMIRLKLVAARQTSGTENLREFSRKLGVSSTSLYEYVRSRNPSLPSLESMEKLKLHVAFSPEELSLVNQALAKKIKLRSAMGVGARQLRRQAKVAVSSLPTPPPARPAVEAKVATSPGQVQLELVTSFNHFLNLLQAHLSGGSAPRVPQLLQRLGWTSPSQLEERDLNQLSGAELQCSTPELKELLHFVVDHIRWLRVSLLALAQLQPDLVRENLLRQLSAELEALWRAYRVARSLVPMEVIREIDLNSRSVNSDKKGNRS